MIVLHLARYDWPNDVRQNPLDLRNVEALADRLGEQHMIVQSRDGRASRWHDGRVTVDLLRPRGKGAIRSLVFLIAGLRAARRVLASQRVEVLNASDLWGALLGCVLRKRFGVGLLVQLQNDFFDPPAAAFGSPLKRRVMRGVASIVCRRADAIRCLSEGIRENALAAGVPADRLVVVGTRVDPALFSPDRWMAAGRTLRQELGIGDEPLVVYVGSLTRRKGVEGLVDAALALAERGPTATLLIVGDGEQGPMLRQLARRAPKRIRFEGRVPHDALPVYLAAADVFAFPSLSEGMPRAVLEAMAMGCAVVATDIDGVRDVVRHGKTGLLVAPADTGALTNALQRLIRDRALGVQLGQAAAAAAIREHGFDRNMDEFADLIRRTAARRPGELQP